MSYVYDLAHANKLGFYTKGQLSKLLISKNIESCIDFVFTRNTKYFMYEGVLQEDVEGSNERFYAEDIYEVINFVWTEFDPDNSFEKGFDRPVRIKTCVHTNNLEGYEGFYFKKQEFSGELLYFYGTVKAFCEENSIVLSDDFTRIDDGVPVIEEFVSISNNELYLIKEKAKLLEKLKEEVTEPVRKEISAIRAEYKQQVGVFRSEIAKMKKTLKDLNVEKTVERAVETNVNKFNDTLNTITEDFKDTVDNLAIQIVERTKNDTVEDMVRAKITEMPIADLMLTVRAENCLVGDGINTVGDLLEYNQDQLCKIPNLGRRTRTEINECLEHNFSITVNNKNCYNF